MPPRCDPCRENGEFYTIIVEGFVFLRTFLFRIGKNKETALKIIAVMASGVFFLLMAETLRAADEEEGTTPQTGFYISFTPSAVGPFSIDTTSPDLSPGTTKTRWGIAIDGGLGYRYNDFRVEGQVMYGRSDADHVSFSGGGGDLSGYYDMWGATVNIFYDIPVGARFRPYVGAGLGGIRFKAHDITLTGFPPTCGSNTLFTYRFMAGISYALTDAWRLILGYRFMGIGGQQDYETGGVPLHGDPIHTHAVQAGIQFYF